MYNENENPFGRTLWGGVLGGREGEGDVTFTLTDDSTFTIKAVNVDSIGPRAENKGVIAVEFFDNDRVVHVPFVKFWTIDYPDDVPPF